MAKLTTAQKETRRAHHELHLERQRRMAPAERPRISPQRNMPGRFQGILPEHFTSMRTCVEMPETEPNDFRYLFRRTGRPTQPEYLWFDIDGVNKPPRVFGSIYSACQYYLDAGWEDASW